MTVFSNGYLPPLSVNPANRISFYSSGLFLHYNKYRQCGVFNQLQCISINKAIFTFIYGDNNAGY